MSDPTISTYWNQTTPAPDSGMQPAVIKSDNATPQDSRTISVPNTGGAVPKTANYTAVAADCGKLLSFNSASALTYTLPATPPSVGTNQWEVAAECVGAGGLTVAATSGAKLDGVVGGTLALAQNSGCRIFTDGTDYFTQRGSASTLTLKHNGTLNGSQTTLDTKAGAGIAITDDGVGGLTWAVQSTSTTNFVQSRSVETNFGFGIGPTTLAYSSNVTGGNALLVSWVFTGGTSVSGACTDTLGNTYTQVFNQTFNGSQTCVFLALNSPAGANTVSVTATVGGSGICAGALSIQEYSGLPTSAAVDTSNFANNGSGGAVTVPITTSAPGMLYLFSCYTSAPSTTTPAVTGFTQREVQSGGAPELFTFDSVATSAGTYSVVFPSIGSSTPNQVFVLALKAKVTAGGSVTSVSATVPSWLTATVTNPTTTPAIAITATTGEPANQFLATPDGATGPVGLRTIVATDIPVGGVSAKTASYTAVAADTGKLISFNSASAVTLTLPATAPNAKWNIEVANIGAGTLTISPNGLNLDGSASSITLATNQGIYISTDATNYFSSRGAGSGGSSFITSLTTTGTSGAASVVSGVLNVPQYSAGGGGALTLISTLTPTGTGTVTFSSLGSYMDLLLVVRGASTASASFSEVHLQFNGDTGGNYDLEPATVNNTTLAPSPVLAGTYLHIGWVPAATGVANMGAAAEATIYDYAGTTFQKAMVARSGIKLANAVASFYTTDNSGWWRNTAAITSVTVFLAVGNYAAGSSVSLYGRS